MSITNKPLPEVGGTEICDIIPREYKGDTIESGIAEVLSGLDLNEASINVTGKQELIRIPDAGEWVQHLQGATREITIKITMSDDYIEKARDYEFVGGKWQSGLHKNNSYT